MNVHQSNAFARIWSLGYHRLTPIIPPGAPISERSSLFKRLQHGDDARGKMPGVRWNDGTWSGFDFVSHESTEADLARWYAMGAGVGVKTGRGLALIDADTLDEAMASQIAKTVERIVGILPVRIGRAPKAGYLVRVSGEFQYARVEFGERNAKGRLTDRVEILYEGRQFVAEGVHPATGKPYRWPGGMPALDDVPVVPAGTLMALLEALAKELPAARNVIVEGGGAEVDQATLRGDLDMVRRAVEATPNTSAGFPTREAYVGYGYAIRAAMGPEHEAEAKALWLDWCARWDEGENDPEVAAADWRRMESSSYRRGASWLYEIAETESGGTFSAAAAMASRWAESDAEVEPLFPDMRPQAGATGSQGSHIDATPYDFPEPSAIPRREVLYGSHYVRRFVSTTAAPTKVGKTSLIIGEALAMASGRGLLGIRPVGALRVWLWNGEDPLDELRRRVAAAMLHHGLTRADLTDDDGSPRLMIDSGRDMEIVLATTGRDGTRIAAPVEEGVVEALRRHRIDVMIVDPFVSSHRVPENDNGAVDMVAKRWARIADRTGCAIELVHHVRKLNGGEVTIEDTRGASALVSAARSARALARMTKTEGVRMGLDAGAARRLFRFADAQSNLALPAGEEDEWMQLASVALGNGGGIGPERFMRGDSVGVVAVWEREAGGGEVMTDVEADALERIRAGEWRKDARAGDAWIGVPVAQALRLDVDDPEDKGRVKALVTDWLRRGLLVEVSRRDEQRKMRIYVEAKTPVEDAGAFD